MTLDLLTKKLHTLTSSDVRHLRKIADDVFEPLTRPFRQRRTEARFDFAGTVRSAARYGDFMPVYCDTIREHRKSRLVIAMSLSGIDRCAAVGLIPLFAELQKFLSFRLFIYTNDIVEARFTRDGFLENDIDIAWNNVAAPVIFNRLADMTFDRQEDTLLLIDNFGGGDSKWFTYWSRENRIQVQEEQSEYLKVPSSASRTVGWTKLRRELAGNYDKIHTSSYAKSLKTWQIIVDRNTKQRWVESPAMIDYLVRWLFHPQFGRVKHAQYRGSDEQNYGQSVPRIKGKFKNIHWLRTIPHAESEYRIQELLRLNVIDHMHSADTIEGFATVLSNIVHGRCTNRLSRETVKFADMIDEPDEIDTPDEEHAEIIEGKEECFKLAVHPETYFPQALEWRTTHHIKGTNDTKEIVTPWSNVDPSDWFPSAHSDLSADWHGSMCALTPNFAVNPAMSKFSLLEEATRFITEIKKIKIVALGSSLVTRTRFTSGVLTETGAHFNLHKTRQLEEHVNDYLSLWSDDYKPYTTHLPLTNVLWCSGGVYDAKVLGYAVSYKESEEWRRTTFHEHGHHMEHICPEIGVFTNYLIVRKTGGLDRKQLIPVYGGTAMPVMDGSKEWITSYAGKWYGRHHSNLPVSTEIIAVHGEYFRSPDTLLRLMLHDPFMVKFMAFVFMGGPVAAIKASHHAKLTAAMDAISQRNIKHTAYTSKSGGRSSGGGRSSWGSGRSTKKDRSKSFGV